MRIYTRGSVILDLTVEETDDNKLAVWFVLDARSRGETINQWLYINCAEDFKWKSVPGSATRRVTFVSRADAIKFVTYLMETRVFT